MKSKSIFFSFVLATMAMGLPACVDDDANAELANITSVSISEQSLQLTIGSSAELSASLEGSANAYTSPSAIAWRTSDASVVAVSNGKLSAVGVGTATVTVRSLDGGHEASCLVTVVPQQNVDWGSVTRYMGADISNLPLYEAAGADYKDIDGASVDLLPFLVDNGMNTMRIRLFVNPENTDDPQVAQDVTYVINLAKRLKNMGLKWMLDFHYSDTWADPSHQTIPAAWASLSVADLKQKIYDYTKESLQAMVEAGVAPDFIQVGNETSYGMLWPTGRVSYSSAANWDVYCAMTQNGCTACREVCPDAKIILHVECTGNEGKCASFLNYMKQYNVDFDIFGLSYYPFWHNKLSTLNSTLNRIESTTDKDIMIVEYAYNYQWYPSDATFTANQLGVDANGNPLYDATPEGQRLMTADLIALLNKHSRVSGLFWWFPEENEAKATGVLSGWLNRGLFDDQTGNALPALYELDKFLGE